MPYIISLYHNIQKKSIAFYFKPVTSFVRNNFSTIVKLLYDVLKKKIKTLFLGKINCWHLKNKIIFKSPIVLCFYSQLLQTELHCVSSQLGFGSVLVQKQKHDDKFHAVFYFSKRTTDCDTRYHSYELECLAII